MNEAEIKVLMSIAYRAGIKDGWNNKDLPTLKNLDDMVDTIYANAMMAKQEAQHEHDECTGKAIKGMR